MTIESRHVWGPDVHPPIMSARTFMESGLMALINVLILWPRGLSLAYASGGNCPPGGDLAVFINPPGTVITDDEDVPTLEDRIRSLATFDRERAGCACNPSTNMNLVPLTCGDCGKPLVGKSLETALAARQSLIEELNRDFPAAE